MTALGASIALALAVLATPGIALLFSGELMAYGLIFALVSVLFFMAGTRLTTKTVARLGKRSSQTRILIIVTALVVVLPNVLSAMVQLAFLAEGSVFAQSTPRLWFIVTILSSILTGIYHFLPVGIIGSAIVQALSLTERLSPVPVGVWMISCSVVVYGILTVALVLGAHYWVDRSRSHVTVHHGPRTQDDPKR